MALPADVKKRLDEQAELARQEFVANWKNWDVEDVARWWHKWCRFERTNHDRLGHILMEVTGVMWQNAVELTDED